MPATLSRKRARTSRKQFRAITYFGVLVGGLIGFVQVLLTQVLAVY